MTTIEKMKHSGAVYRFQGIVDCLDKKSATEEEIECLRELTKDSFVLGGRKMSTYAYATLDILGIEKYNGNDEAIYRFAEQYKKEKP